MEELDSRNGDHMGRDREMVMSTSVVEGGAVVPSGGGTSGVGGSVGPSSYIELGWCHGWCCHEWWCHEWWGHCLTILTPRSPASKKRRRRTSLSLSLSRF